MLVRCATVVLGVCLSLFGARPDAALTPVKPSPLTSLDRHGDALPPRALARLGTVRYRHGPASCVAFSPDGKSLAVGGRGLGIRLYDPDTGRVRARLGADESSYTTGSISLAFSPDGKTMAAAHGPVRLVDLASGRDLWRLESDSLHASVIAFSPDGKLIASDQSSGHNSTICIWDKEGGKKIRELSSESWHIYGVTFSPDGKCLAVAGSGAAHIWQVNTGKLMYRIPGRESSLCSLAFSPDGTELAVSWGYEANLHFLDASTGKLLRTWEIPEDSGAHATYSPDGNVLATAGGSGVIRLWDRATGAALLQLRGHDTWVGGMAFSPDGKRLAAVARGAIFLWDTTTGERLSTVAGHDRAVTALTFSRDGRELYSYGEDGKLLSWDWALGTENFLFRAPPDMVYGGTLGPDAEVLVTRGYDVVHCWGSQQGRGERELGKRLAVGNTVSPLALSPDGRLIAAPQEGTAIFVGELATGKELHILKGHSPDPAGFGEVSGLAFAPDGKTLASTSSDNTVRLWDARSGKMIRTWGTGNGNNMRLEFAPDGRTLAVAENLWGDSIRLWDVSTAKEVTPPLRHSSCTALAFSADGRYLATGGNDDRIELWETATGQHVLRLTGQHSGVHSLTFAPNGRVLASGGGDTTVLLWDLIEGTKGARSTTQRPEEAEVTTWWEALAGPASEAARSAWRLVAAPEQALPLLKKHLRAVSAPAPERLDKLVADLASDRFSARQKATLELEDLGDLAVPALRAALAKRPALEATRRMERLLARCEPGVVPTGDRLRVVRALLVLEQIGTPEAREQLRALSEGAPAARLTREARAALDRLARTR
jgi:WD40 repeat protein